MPHGCPTLDGSHRDHSVFNRCAGPSLASVTQILAAPVGAALAFEFCSAPGTLGAGSASRSASLVAVLKSARTGALVAEARSIHLRALRGRVTLTAAMDIRNFFGKKPAKAPAAAPPPATQKPTAPASAPKVSPEAAAPPKQATVQCRPQQVPAAPTPGTPRR